MKKSQTKTVEALVQCPKAQKAQKKKDPLGTTPHPSPRHRPPRGDWQKKPPKPPRGPHGPTTNWVGEKEKWSVGTKKSLLGGPPYGKDKLCRGNQKPKQGRMVRSQQKNHQPPGPGPPPQAKQLPPQNKKNKVMTRPPVRGPKQEGVKICGNPHEKNKKRSPPMHPNSPMGKQF